MYDYAITSARKLNPSWTENRTQPLSWGEIENRPYLRSIYGYALALHTLRRNDEAIEQGEKLLRWNRNDNQGMRKLLCNWYLQENKLEDCLQLLREQDTECDSDLAYTDVLIQFLRWKRGKYSNDPENRSVQKALFKAIENNHFIPDLLLDDNYKEKVNEYYSPGGLSEAEGYVNRSYETWRHHPDALEWLRSQKFSGGSKVPDEMHLIQMLNNDNMNILVKCKHTDLHGCNQVVSALRVTQNRERCVGCALADFVYPDELNNGYHEPSNPILMHNNGMGDPDYDSIRGWRKTKYSDVLEIPFWKIILQFLNEV